MPALLPLSIPSPSSGVLWLGPIPLRAYGILMVTAMVVAVTIAYVRYKRRGGVGDVVLDTSIWAIPFGLVGARLYHVITHPHDYFGTGMDPWAIVKVWEGGMAIWGAVGFGAVGAVIGLRIAGQRVGPFADALAPGLLIAQVIGRWGNYFNQEIFGGPTTMPWGLEIDAAHLPAGYAEGTLFHPTFLYEGLWNLAMALLIMWLDKKIRFKSGQVMSLYLMAYGLGRFIIEPMRMDEAGEFLGLRVNAWASLAAFVLGLVIFFICAKVGASTRVSPAEREEFLEKHPEVRAKLEEKAAKAEGAKGEENTPGP